MKIKNNKDIINAIGKTVTLGTIDMDAFLGRDHHPSKNMRGTKVKIIGVLEGGNGMGQFTNDIEEILSGTWKFTENESYVIFNTVTPGGKLYEIVDYEIR